MSIGATSVSIKADKPYLKALRALAYQKGIAVAELVRGAVDAQYKEQLQPHLDFFYAEIEDKNPQLKTKGLSEITNVR